MLGPFATASRRMPPVLHCHSPGVATVARRHCCTPPAQRCPQQHRQRMTEGTAMAQWNGPNYGKFELAHLIAHKHTVEISLYHRLHSSGMQSTESL